MGHIIDKENIGRILRGFIVSSLMGILLTGCVAYCIQQEWLSIEKFSYIMPLIWFATSMTGSYSTGKCNDQKFLPLFAPALLLLVQLAVAILVFDGAKGTAIAICLISSISGGFLGVFLRVRNKKRTHKHRRKHAHR